MKFVTGNTPNPSQSNAPITAASIFAGMMNTSGESAHGTSFKDICLFDPEEIPDVSDLVELATINNESVHRLVSLTPINDNLSTVTMVDQPIIDNDNQPIIDNDNQPIIDNDKQPTTDTDNKPIGRDNDVSHKRVQESCEAIKLIKKISIIIMKKYHLLRSLVIYEATVTKPLMMSIKFPEKELGQVRTD